MCVLFPCPTIFDQRQYLNSERRPTFNIKGKSMNKIKYVDDISFVGCSRKGSPTMRRPIKKMSHENSLDINNKKIKTMIIVQSQLRKLL